MNKSFITINAENIYLIKEVYTEFMDEAYTGRPDDFDTAALNFLKTNQGYLSVVKNESQVLGFVEFRILPKKLRDNQNIVEITSIFVRPEFRKEGLGRDLVEYVKEFAKANNCYSVVLYSGLELIDAHGFYERCGFKKSAYFFKMSV